MSCNISIHKGNDKYMKDYNKDKELPYSIYWDANDLYGWKLSVDNFQQEENASKFYGTFIKNYEEIVHKG